MKLAQCRKANMNAVMTFFNRFSDVGKLWKDRSCVCCKSEGLV